MQGQRRVEIELQQLRAAIGDFQPRQHVQAEHQGLRFRPAVRLDVADHDVHALLGHLAAGLEHGVGLADARRRAEEDFQLPPRLLGLFGLHAGQQGVRIGALVVIGPQRRRKCRQWQTASDLPTRGLSWLCTC